jgi:glycosyltransferase involved in cell wall biosynthesis
MRSINQSIGEKKEAYQKGDRVDVVVLTKNSERILKRSLNSVYDNVPVNRLIVCDSYSTDGTLGILQDFQIKYGNVDLLQSRGTRGNARQEAISHVKTEWFMFVDSDVILSPNWFQNAIKLIKEDVGAVWGMEIWSVLRGTRVLSLFERLNLKVFERRGGTQDLLVRYKAVKDISIPSHLHTYEDSYIKSWIRMKGYEVIAVYEPYCFHYRPNDVWTIRQSIRIIAGDLKFAVKHPLLIPSYAFYAAIVLYEKSRGDSTAYLGL